MQTKSTHWPSLLVLIVLGVSSLLLLLVTAALGLASLMDLANHRGDPAGEMIGATAFGFVIILLLTCGWFILQKTRGLEQADAPLKFPYALWMVVVIPAVVIGFLVIGGLITTAEKTLLNWFVLPILTVLIIIPPIWLLFGIASNGVELGPRWRVFTVLGLGLTLGPFIMILLEMLLMVGIIVTVTVYIAIAQPALLNELSHLSTLINQNVSEDAAIALLTPYLMNPSVIGTALLYIALLVPMIEELFKPLAVWLFARKLASPAQGFAMGVLSGAAFAMVESLNASADGSTTWSIIVAVRTGTSALHMLTTGLVGWGIVYAFQERKFGRPFAAYLAAILIHGIWNAAAAGTGLAALGETIGKPEWLYQVAPALVCGLMVLGLGVLVLLFVINRDLQKTNKLAHVEEEKVQSAA